MIQELQADGFNLKGIERLLNQNVGAAEQFLSFRRALDEFDDEQPRTFTREELAERFGTEIDRALKRAVEAGAQKLASLAERTHVQEGTLARSLLASALDEADPGASRITEILDGIPGAWERAQESIEQARRGETVPLSEL